MHPSQRPFAGSQGPPRGSFPPGNCPEPPRSTTSNPNFHPFNPAQYKPQGPQSYNAASMNPPTAAYNAPSIPRGPPSSMQGLGNGPGSSQPIPVTNPSAALQEPFSSMSLHGQRGPPITGPPQMAPQAMNMQGNYGPPGAHQQSCYRGNAPGAMPGPPLGSDARNSGPPPALGTPAFMGAPPRNFAPGQLPSQTAAHIVSGPPRGPPIGMQAQNYPNALNSMPGIPSVPGSSQMNMPNQGSYQNKYQANIPPAYGQQPPHNPASSKLASGNFQQTTDVMDAYGAGASMNSVQTPVISDELMASQCSAEFMKASVNVIPYSQDFANKCHLTLGIVIRPLAAVEKELDVINFGQSGVIRCRHCRTYINPFAYWVDNGRRWRCNLCGISNDVPSSYFCHLNANQQRQDRQERPELCNGSVEIVAPSEYMMRPPQPPCYVFVIDVSAPAIVSGALSVIARTIQAQLDNLPGSPRTRVGFITFDSSIHFYNLKSTLKAPQMMVIPDLDEIFIPIPDELLVNLSDSRAVIDLLLDGLVSIHENTRNMESALGPAIRVAFKLMSSIGGKMMVFQSSMPTTGQGALRNRENPRVIGTDKEHTLLTPTDTFYRTHAIDFCRQQVSVDTFLFSAQYMDIASLACLSRFSAGQLYYYPGFSKERDAIKLQTELSHCLTRETAWESVMRVRCTKGMRLANFYGNSFLRGPDLLALPTCNADSTFALEIVHSDALLSSPTISIQAALLYTTSCGERRIRVHTMCLPVSKLFAEIFRSVDIDTLCNIIAKNALETCLKTGFESARARLQTECVEVVRAYGTSGAFGARQSAQNAGYQVQLPESLQLLPLYTMSLLKNVAFRGGNDLNVDQRCFYQYQLNNMRVSDSRTFIYPRMFSLHAMPVTAGVMKPSDTAIELPPLLNLSVDRLTSDGIFLLEDSVAMYLWIGRTVAVKHLRSLLGVESMENVNTQQMQLLQPHDDYSTRVHTILDSIRKDHPPHMQIILLREGDVTEGRLFWKLVEDRASFPGGTISYAEFLGQLSRSCLSAIPTR